MTNQPKYYAGIAECGCAMAGTMYASTPTFAAVVTDRWKASGWRVEERECFTLMFGGHTCGKDGAK